MTSGFPCSLRNRDFVGGSAASAASPALRGARTTTVPRPPVARPLRTLTPAEPWVTLASAIPEATSAAGVGRESAKSALPVSESEDCRTGKGPHGFARLVQFGNLGALVIGENGLDLRTLLLGPRACLFAVLAARTALAPNLADLLDLLLGQAESLGSRVDRIAAPLVRGRILRERGERKGAQGADDDEALGAMHGVYLVSLR